MREKGEQVGETDLNLATLRCLHDNSPRRCLCDFDYHVHSKTTSADISLVDHCLLTYRRVASADFCADYQHSLQLERRVHCRQFPKEAAKG